MQIAKTSSPLSEFQRNPRDHVRRLKKSGRPEVLTLNGRPAVVVQSAKAYQGLLDEIERLETIAGIKRGLESFERGEGIPAEEVFADLERRKPYLKGK